MRRHFFSRSLSFSFSCRNRIGGPKGRGHRGEGVRARESIIFFVAGGRWTAEHSPGRRPPTASESEARAGSQCTHLSQAPSLRERKGAARAVRNRNGGRRRRREARWSATEKEENMGGRARGGGRGGLPPTRGRRGLVPAGRRNGDGAPIAHRPGLPSLWLSLRREDLFSPFKGAALPQPPPARRRPLVPVRSSRRQGLPRPSVHNLRNLTVRHGGVCPPPRLCPAVSSCPLYLVAPRPSGLPALSLPFLRSIIHPSHRAIFHNSKSSISNLTIFLVFFSPLPWEGVRERVRQEESFARTR